MNDERGPELSRIVNLIMENPHIIEEISKLAAKDESASTHASEPEAETHEETQSVSIPASTYASNGGGAKQKRSMLLSALKPYVSKERAKALDSMVSIAEMLEIMRSR